MRRSLVAQTSILVLLAVGLSGCTAPADTDAYVPDAPVTYGPEDLQRVLIRGHTDRGEIGAHDDVYRVRFAAVTYDQEVVPFDGFVKVFLEPQDPEEQDWVPRFWWQDVTKDNFSINTELPYVELTADGAFLHPGEPVHLTIEAQLPDGRTITGERDSYA